MQIKSTVLVQLMALATIVAAGPLRLTELGEGDSYTRDSFEQESMALLPSGPFAIVAHKSSNKCLDVYNGNYKDGTAVGVYDCHGGTPQKWIFEPSGLIRISGTNFCLDAGAPKPKSGTKLKIWTCLTGHPHQTWMYFPDGRIKQTSSQKCLDLTGGKLDNHNPTQMLRCEWGNMNQVWYQRT